MLPDPLRPEPEATGAVHRAAEAALAGFGRSRRLRLPRLIIWTIAASVLALLLWTALAQVEQVVHAQGRIIPSGKPQLVQHLEGGIVTKVMVSEGMHVEKGQALVNVSDLFASSTRDEKRARIQGLRARAARLAAEAAGAREFQLPDDLDRAAPEVRDEREAFQARMAKLVQSARVLEEQANQKRQEMREQDGHRKGLQGELEVARQQYALVTGLHARGAGSQLELLEARARVERLGTQIKDSDSAIPRLQAAEAELLAKVAEIRAQFRSEAQTQLAEANVELQRLGQQVRADDDRLTRTVVTAPVTGVVNKLSFNTVGGVVKPGDTLLELTPDGDFLLIEAWLMPSDRGALDAGEPAAVKVSAYDYTQYGVLFAKVTEVSPDTLADEKGERRFRVALAVPKDEFKRFGQRLSPGMTVTADIVVGKRSVLGYLTSPIHGLAANALRDAK